MWNIALRILKDSRLSLLVYTIVSVLFAWMYVGIFPSMAAQSEKLMEAFKNYPKEMLEAFGVNITEQSFRDIHSFLAMENFSMIWPVFVIAITVSLGSNAIAGEIEKGTISILLSQPLSRVKLFFSKYLAGTLYITSFVVASIFLIIPLIKIQNIDFRIMGFLTMTALGWLFGMAIYSIVMMISSMISEKGKVLFLSVGLIVVMYALNILAALKDSLDSLKYLSFFYYYDYQTAFLDNKIDWLSITVFAGVAALCTTIGVIVFKKRDITV